MLCLWAYTCLAALTRVALRYYYAAVRPYLHQVAFLSGEAYIRFAVTGQRHQRHAACLFFTRPCLPRTFQIHKPTPTPQPSVPASKHAYTRFARQHTHTNTHFASALAGRPLGQRLGARLKAAGHHRRHRRARGHAQRRQAQGRGSERDHGRRHAHPRKQHGELSCYHVLGFHAWLCLWAFGAGDHCLGCAATRQGQGPVAKWRCVLDVPIQGG
jgi:hypothetical protein